ncbi:MAG: WD40 repeat domain-containing protein [Roseibacillus sp.]|jgi:WD40 repeat protein
MSELVLSVKDAWVSSELKHDRQLFRAQYSPDGRYVAAVGLDRLVHVWDLSGETPAHRSFEAHGTWVSSLAFHPSEALLFTADYHGTIHCWEYEAGASAKPRWTVTKADADNVRALLVTPDGLHLVSGGDDAILKVWSTKDGKEITRMEGHEECVFSLAVSPDGIHLVSGDLLGSIRQWSVADSWKPVRELDAKLLHTRKDNFLADVGGVRSLAFDAEGRWLAAGGMKEAKSNAFCPGTPTVLVFDWATGGLKRELGIKGKSDGPFNALQFLENGTLAGHTEILHSPSELAFWNIEQPEPIHSMVNHSAYDLSLHPDGLQLLAAGYDPGGSQGNGAQKRFSEKYVPNGTALRTFSLFAKPANQAKAIDSRGQR